MVIQFIHFRLKNEFFLHNIVKLKNMKKLILILLIAFALPTFSIAEDGDEPQYLTVMGVLNITQFGNIMIITCPAPWDVICFKIELSDIQNITVVTESGSGKTIYDVESDYTIGTDENGNPMFTFELKD